MNRAFAIILIPPLLVLIGYVVVFRAMGGTPPAYWSVIVPVVLMGGALWWLGRRTRSKAGSGAR